MPKLIYRPEIDALRALSVVAVMLFHSGFSAFSRGFIGVDVFFVISGYLITRQINTELEAGTFRFIDFYNRRARRLLPALFFVLACCIPCAWLLMTPVELERFSATSIAAVLFSANFGLWRSIDYFDADAVQNPLLHSWSLSVEEQFYFVFPTFLLLIWKWRPQWMLPCIVAAALISLGISEWGWRNFAVANYYLLPSRIWQLMAGAICALLLHRRAIRPNDFLASTGLFIVLLSLFASSPNWPAPSIYTAIPVVGTTLIILFCNTGGYANRVLSMPPLVGLGLISYSAYLWHQPLFAFIRLSMINPPSPLLLIAAIMATILLAWASWKWVEQPFRNHSHAEFPVRKIVLPMVLAGGVIVGIGLFAVASKGVPFRLPRDIVNLTSYDLEHLANATIHCTNQPIRQNFLDQGCKIGTLTGRPTIALVGDSHALAILPALDRRLRANGLSGVAVVRSGCPPLIPAAAGQNLHSNQAETQPCLATQVAFFESLKQDNGFPDTLIIFARWPFWIGQGAFDNGEGGREEISGTNWNTDSASQHQSLTDPNRLVKSIRAMLASGRRVVLIYPIPEMGWHVPSRLSKVARFGEGILPDTASISQARFLKRARSTHLAFDILGSHPKLIRVHPDLLFCNINGNGRCVAHFNKRPIYVDDDHLSDFGADLLVSEILKTLL